MLLLGLVGNKQWHGQCHNSVTLETNSFTIVTYWPHVTVITLPVSSSKKVRISDTEHLYPIPYLLSGCEVLSNASYKD
jgi:hypothetical protein